MDQKYIEPKDTLFDQIHSSIETKKKQFIIANAEIKNLKLKAHHRNYYLTQVDE